MNRMSKVNGQVRIMKIPASEKPTADLGSDQNSR